MMRFSIINCKVLTFGLFVLSLFFLVTIDSVNAAISERDVLIKGSNSSVYYYASDGKRYVFPNDKVYHSWFTNFNSIVVVTDLDLGSIPLGKNVTYRPGWKMVKITTDPKVYAVDRGGMLRWITTEELAKTLYGSAWNTFIDDVPDTFFENYTVGSPIQTVSDFNPESVILAVTTINGDKNLPVGSNPRIADTKSLYTRETVPQQQEMQQPTSTTTPGVLSIVLDPSNPQEQIVRSGTTNLTLLKLRFSASSEEDIRINRFNIILRYIDMPYITCDVITNMHALLDTTSLNASINDAFNPYVTVPKGSYKTITIVGDVHYVSSECPHTFQVGLSVNNIALPWGVGYGGKFNVEAIGIDSGKKLYVGSEANVLSSGALYGNNISVKLLQYQNI